MFGQASLRVTHEDPRPWSLSKLLRDPRGSFPGLMGHNTPRLCTEKKRAIFKIPPYAPGACVHVRLDAFSSSRPKVRRYPHRRQELEDSPPV